MIKYYLRRQIAKFERMTGYDASYARELVDAAPVLLFHLFLTNTLARRPREISAEAWYAAKLAAALDADCGPCAQLVVVLATKDGVSEATLRGLLTNELDSVPEDARLTFLYVGHALRRCPTAAPLRTQLVDRYGVRAFTRLAHQAAFSHLFPTFKYLLGHGYACTRVRVGGETLPVHRRDVAARVAGSLQPAGL